MELLTKDILAHIRQGDYTIDDIDNLYSGLEVSKETLFRGMMRAFIIYLLAGMVMEVSTLVFGGFGPAFLFTVIIILAIPVIVFPLVYLMTIGRMCFRFNRAMARGYPDEAGNYHL